MRKTLATAALAGAVLTGCGHGSAPGTRGEVGHGDGASCAGPQLSARPFRAGPPAARVVVRRGERLHVHGRFFTRDCFDSGPGVGRRDRPLARVVLDLVDRRGRTTFLAVARPSGPATGFAVTLRIPATAATGPARIVGRPLRSELALSVR